ncbi:MAG: haloalkane dehalogenase [Alphaproteobacteria bacterium]|nr:haloalkane dehalogenase [Alphaproteobacteria bacterium]
MSSKSISAAYPFTSKFAEIDSTKMHYIDEGEGDPIVFLHGNSTWSYMWRNIIPYLSGKARCIAVDLVGHGQSDKPDIDYRYVTHYKYIEGFLDGLGLKNFTMVLHDWGGGLGFNYAMHHEDELKGLAFMETFVRTFDSWDDWPPDLVEGFKQFRSKDVGWDLIVEKNVFMEQILPYGIKRGLSDEEMQAYLAPHADKKNRKQLWVWPQELPIEGKPADTSKIIHDYVAKLGRSPVPKLLFYVDPGAIVPEATAEMCEQNFPNLEKVFLGPGGHYVAEDYPHEIGEKLSSWYDAISG